MAVYHGGWTKFNRHLVLQYDNFVSVYKIVTASRNYHGFRSVHIYSFLLSVSNKTYYTCHEGVRLMSLVWISFL